MTPVLDVRNLSRAFGAIQAVDNVSFTLAKGELLALIGPNGAGKSTCFNMLMGQLKPSSGAVFLNGAPLAGLGPRRIWRKGVGRTFQITATYPSMTVVENVQMALISYHNRTYSVLPYAHRLYRDQALNLLALVGMADQADRHSAVLAYGDLKRLELATALAGDPGVLLMDEPTAGMAPRERIALMQLTADIVSERGVSVLFTEHDMDVVFAHAHRIMVLNRGQLIADGSVETIRNDARVQEVYLGGGTVFADA
ncbi:ABC transporter ATP-binding protein [Actibacterium sp. 188UL27-1]|uniref:ABC transporter ATP-binding protein n=1 Tax=Actibacterium sp. 188UL27-1 TaxID=2786961 RepID=UPI00195B504D|nr:ABC transporter ATP-binding protein [Actibacterium sp. 188UL27-1]MBM7066943.1 ABC transporter ATP-binding protein [Actibacterium sp. 188UL27-1]